MRKRKILLPLTSLALLVSFGLVACNGGNNQQSAQQEKITVTAEGGKTSLILGQSVQLSASVAGVTWSADKTDIATVSSTGLVESKAVGTVKITASKNGYRDGSINIKIDLEKINITAPDNKNSIAMDESLLLSADQQGVTWASSDEKVATVDQSGKVTGVYVGSATISASKEGFNAGSFALTVTRSAALEKLHFEDADHYAADGWWGTAAEGYSPVYERSSGNASDGKCIAHMDNGDKETLTFTSNAAIKAELVMTMASSSAVEDMSQVMEAKFNNVAIDLANKGIVGGSTSEFEEFSLGELNIINGDNVLELSFKASAPYIDDLAFYSKQTAQIAVKAAPEKQQIQVDGELPLIVNIGEEKQIALKNVASLEGVTFSSDKETVATVSSDGKITGVALGSANITIAKEGYLSARIEVTVEKAIIAGEIRVEAENNTNELPSGFHMYTDRTSGITNGHSGSAYITGYDVNSACSLEYSFESSEDQTMTLIIAGAPHYQMSEPFNFSTDCTIKLNDAALTVNADAVIQPGSTMGAATVEVTIGTVNVKAGVNTFVIEFSEKAPALDCYRFMPIA